MDNNNFNKKVGQIHEQLIYIKPGKGEEVKFVHQQEEKQEIETSVSWNDRFLSTIQNWINFDRNCGYNSGAYPFLILVQHTLSRLHKTCSMLHRCSVHLQLSNQQGGHRAAASGGYTNNGGKAGGDNFGTHIWGKEEWRIAR
jgi:hypothetical protein